MTFEIVLKEAKKIGLEDRNHTEEVASAQVHEWERSAHLKQTGLAFVAEVQQGRRGEVGKEHWGQFTPR